MPGVYYFCKMTDEISKTIITGSAGILSINLISTIPIETITALTIQAAVAAATIYKLFLDIRKAKKND